MAQDYYHILNVDKNASDSEIKKSYRKLAQKYHPDKKGGDEQKFKELNQAYEVIGDPKKREAYDQFGEAAFKQYQGGYRPEDLSRSSQQGSSQGQQFSGADFDFGSAGFGDIFGSMFGGRAERGQSGHRHGADLQSQVTITLEEAFRGVTKELTFQKHVRCDRCGGDGAEPGSKIEKCPTCNGRGEIRSTRQTAFGQAVQVTACPTCGGTGKKIITPCRQCNGRGFVQSTRTYTVKIPAGAKNGARIRFKGEGEPAPAHSPGAKPGNLFVIVNIQHHPVFERAGDDLLSQEKITFSTAALGGKAKVRTIDGLVDLKIPAGTQSHSVIRMRGKGMPRATGSGRGDQLVRVVIDVPKKLSAREKELLEELQKVR